MVLRLAELYVSIQGEGLHVGSPTIFTRFGGCNLRCPGWPCDTQYAIDPKYRNEWERIEPMELVDRILDLNVPLVCLTGGEPFLQPKEDLEYLVTELTLEGVSIEAFSNGTLEYPVWATRGITFCMDWKLQGSGEDYKNTQRLENVMRLAASGRPQAVKFVVKDRQDYDLAKALWGMYLMQYDNITTFVGRVWSDDPNELTDAQLVDWVLKDAMPWKLNVQLHNYIWDRNERAR